jgi:hypothetical protein
MKKLNLKLQEAVINDINVRREAKKLFRELWPFGTMPRKADELIDRIHVGEAHEKYSMIQKSLDELAKQFGIVE